MRHDPEIACTGCGFGGESAGPVGFYDLGDEMCCDVHRVTAYCCAEGRIRAAEKLSTSKNTKERSRRSRRRREDEITGFLITREVRARTRRARRAAPAQVAARCLRCGSTDVVPLEWGEKAHHPGCRGNGELYYRPFIVREWRGACDAYDRDGRFLREAPRDPHDRADIECTGCSFCGRVWSTKGFYELESGVRFPVRETTAWCLEEERVVAAEDLQSGRSRVRMSLPSMKTVEGIPSVIRRCRWPQSIPMGHEGTYFSWETAMRAFLMLILGGMFVVGVILLGYGVITLLDLVASPPGGESMASSTLGGIGLFATFVGGVLAAIGGGTLYSMQRERSRRRGF